MSTMSPLKIKLCLHYACSDTDDEWIHSGAPIVDETMRQLVEAGLLFVLNPYKSVDRVSYEKTAKLTAYVALLCNTPLPVQKWVDPTTYGVIEVTK